MPAPVHYYTEELRRRGEERRRLTRQLSELVGKVADAISDSVPVGTEVVVDGLVYGVIERRSNIDSEKFLAVSGTDYPAWSVLTNRKPGSSFCLHGDLRAWVQVADRQCFLHFANHLPEIVRKFEVEEEKIIAALRSAFERLRQVAEREVDSK